MNGKFDNTGAIIDFDLYDTVSFNLKIDDLSNIMDPDNMYVLENLVGVEFTYTIYDQSYDVFVTTLIVS